MKLVMKLETPIRSLTPRDVRDFLASVVTKDEYREKILWHEHIPPALIFRKPTQNGHAEVINYFNDIELMEHLKRTVIHKEIYNAEGKSKIKKALLKTENFELPQSTAPYFAVYKTRTPIIIASNSDEIERVRKIKGNEKALRKFLIDFILDSIFYQTEYYLGFKPLGNYKKQLLIDVADIKFFFVPYPKKEVTLSFPSVKCRIISNFLLPRFVGYRIGYGFGELIADG